MYITMRRQLCADIRPWLCCCHGNHGRTTEYMSSCHVRNQLSASCVKAVLCGHGCAMVIGVLLMVILARRQALCVQCLLLLLLCADPQAAAHVACRYW
jgi:hypothetical protein